jgi:hypothetical protein
LSGKDLSYSGNELGRLGQGLVASWSLGRPQYFSRVMVINMNIERLKESRIVLNSEYKN